MPINLSMAWNKFYVTKKLPFHGAHNLKNKETLYYFFDTSDVSGCSGYVVYAYSFGV